MQKYGVSGIKMVCFFCQNIYANREIDIGDFEKIEMTSVFRNEYRLYLKNGKSFNFRLKHTDDFKLLLKADDQYYAKELTRRLNKLK